MNNSSNEDIRWKQRFNSFVLAFRKLDTAVELAGRPNILPDEKTVCELAVIKTFEITHELAWNVLKDYLQEQGVSNLTASKNSTKAAFEMGLIEDGEAWMEMIDARNTTVHVYDEEQANEIYDKICGKFYPAFEQLKQQMNKLLEQDNE